MAIDFFKREEVKTQFLAVESLNLIYNLLTTLLIIILPRMCLPLSGNAP